jgi:hypothetical protein
MWRAIQHLTDHLGAKTLSFGRTDPHQEGLRRYKLGWGTEEKTISYLKYHLASESYSSGKRSASSKRLFSAVPMSVSRRIGAALYPHLG